MVNITRNQMGVVMNTFQGSAKRVLCVCSGGILRSPSTAKVLGEMYGYNTRAAGAEHSYALIPTTDALVMWADEIVCLMPEHEQLIKFHHKEVFDHNPDKRVVVLNIPDNYAYMDPDLVELIKERYDGKK